jgi:hypothetical protein
MRSLNPGDPLPAEAAQQHANAMKADDLFSQAMLLARARGLEKVHIGVVTAAGTDHARFTPARGRPASIITSSAGWCAEEGGGEPSGSDYR